MCAPCTLTLAVLAAVPQRSQHGTSDGDAVRKILEARGLSDAQGRRDMFALAASRLIKEGLAPSTRCKAYWVPGRIEIAGKHTDYAGGRSLLAATSRGFALVSVDRDDDACRIFTSLLVADAQDKVLLRISPDLEPRLGHWSAYPATAIRRLARNFGISRGADIAVECDLPESSGMSTSSAVICYMWMVLSERNQIEDMAAFKENIRTPEELYSYLGFIENGQDCGSVLLGDKGVGTFGGSEDHTAIMASEPGKVKMFSFCPTVHEGTFAFPSELAFVIAVSGALANKTVNAMADYNNAAALAQDAAAAWVSVEGRHHRGGELERRPRLAGIVQAVRAELGPEGPDFRVRAKVSAAIDVAAPIAYPKGTLTRRFQQFFDESEIFVPRLAQALAEDDRASLGLWSDHSHSHSVHLLMNTLPETEWLPQEARRLGAHGASAFGAGFGGSCWAIVDRKDADDFSRRWAKAYSDFRLNSGTRKEADVDGIFFVMTPGCGAFSLSHCA